MPDARPYMVRYQDATGATLTGFTVRGEGELRETFADMAARRPEITVTWREWSGIGGPETPWRTRDELPPAAAPADHAPAAVDYARSPMLHQNGRGLEHEKAFRAATEDDQARHLKRQHMLADVDGARRTATDPGKPLASLSEAHEWWHIRQRRHD